MNGSIMKASVGNRSFGRLNFHFASRMRAMKGAWRWKGVSDKQNSLARRRHRQYGDSDLEEKKLAECLGF